MKCAKPILGFCLEMKRIKALSQAQRLKAVKCSKNMAPGSKNTISENLHVGSSYIP